jgi:hypothetical protein
MKRIGIVIFCLFVLVTLCFAAEKVAPLSKTPVTTKSAELTPKPESVLPVAGCCISGKYSGMKTDTTCIVGHKPEKNKFTMDITQAGKCGNTWQGTVTGSEGNTTTYSGTVAVGGPKGCCAINASSTSGTDDVHIKGTLCKKGLKWEAKGDFNDKFCKGTWEMNQ